MRNYTSQGRNYVKAKALGVLAQAADATESESERRAWMAVPDIARAARVDVSSLGILIRRWVQWHYCLSRDFRGVLSDGRVRCFYRIAARGLSYYNDMPEWYPRFNESVAELLEIEADFDNNYYHQPVTLAPIYWVVDPLNLALAIRWPFETVNDINRILGFHKPIIRTRDRQDAMATAYEYYRVRCSPEFTEITRQVEQHYISIELDKLKSVKNNNAKGY